MNLKAAGGTGAERVIFLDNLRYFFVICVILQHSANAYNDLSWWPVAEDVSSIIAAWLSAFFDAFTMPLLLFFVLFSMIYRVKRSWFEPVDHPVGSKEPSILATLKLLAAGGLLLCMLLVIRP